MPQDRESSYSVNFFNDLLLSGLWKIHILCGFYKSDICLQQAIVDHSVLASCFMSCIAVHQSVAGVALASSAAAACAAFVCRLLCVMTAVQFMVLMNTKARSALHRHLCLWGSVVAVEDVWFVLLWSKFKSGWDADGVTLNRLPVQNHTFLHAEFK